jgi:hypothetical protein
MQEKPAATTNRRFFRGPSVIFSVFKTTLPPALHPAAGEDDLNTFTLIAWALCSALDAAAHHSFEYPHQPDL